MNVSQQTIINAPVSQLWKILAEDYDQISGWAAAVLESGPNPEVPVGEGRVCLTTVGTNIETITHKDKNARTFSYNVVPEKAPFFFKGVENTFDLKPLGNNQTEVSMSANVDLSPVIGTLLGPLVRKRMLKGFVGILEELKQYAETGEVHVRKQRSIALHNA